MGSVAILLSGMAVVIGGILVLRMHAFLALLLGSLTVAALTPAETIYQTEINSDGWRVVASDSDDSPPAIAAADQTAADQTADDQTADNAIRSLRLLTGPKRSLDSGTFTLFRQSKETRRWESLGLLQLQALEKLAGAEMQIVRYSTSEQLTIEELQDPQPGDMLVSEADVNAANAAMSETLSDRIAAGFGKTCKSIGILIALASIVGQCLLASGAAQRVVVSLRNAFGEDRAPWAFLVSGFVVAIPVFFDTVFLLLIPLAKAMRLKTGKNYLLYVLAIIAGGTMAHSLVPPTPGPMLVASELGVTIGAMIIGGTLVGALAALGGYAYAVWANRRWDIPLREATHATGEALEQLTKRDHRPLPPLWLSLAPILLPVFLIAAKSVIEFQYPANTAVDVPRSIATVRPLIDTLGQKNIALIVATAIGLFTLGWHNRASRRELTATVQAALSGGAVIVLITGAGGSFGAVLRQSNIAGIIQDLVPAGQAGITLLLLAFVITAVIRVAQGSATIAMITSVGIVAPLAAAMTLPYHPLYLALAVGCGSKPLPWMNDSGFWMIGRMSGMSEPEMLKTMTVMLTVMGLVGMFFTVLGAWLLPLV